MRKFNKGDIIKCREDSDHAINWIDHYATVLESQDPTFIYTIKCVNTVTKATGKGNYNIYFIEDNFRVLSIAERVLYAE